MVSTLRYSALALLVMGAVLVTCFSAAADELAERQVELKKGDRIIFFGDSLTALAGKEAPKEHVTKGYVRIVREKLEAFGLEHLDCFLHARQIDLVIQLLKKHLELQRARGGRRRWCGSARPRANSFPLQARRRDEAGRKDRLLVELCSQEVHLLERCVAEVGAADIRERKVGLGEISVAKVTAAEAGRAEIALYYGCTCE